MSSPWPDGFESAASFTFDLDAEEVWYADEHAEERPGVYSQGTYGPRVAVPAIAALLRRYGVSATFFVPGRVVERYESVVRFLIDEGHEIAHHGYTHRSPASLSREEEAEEIARGSAALRRIGVEPRGYRAPSWDTTPHTIGLVAADGMGYSSNLMDDYLPYLHPGTSVVELPVHWILDDAPHFWFSVGSWTRSISSVATTRQIWKEEGGALASRHGLSNWTFHPQVTGRPSRLVLLEELISEAVSDPAQWVAPSYQVADYVREHPERFEAARRNEGRIL